MPRPGRHLDSNMSPKITSTGKIYLPIRIKCHIRHSLLFLESGSRERESALSELQISFSQICTWKGQNCFDFAQFFMVYEL